MFEIEIKRFNWVDGSDDCPEDLCLHGELAVTIGAERIERKGTVSAFALYLLRTLTEDRLMGTDNPMFPCCGHTMWANDAGDGVEIQGCGNGADWTVRHVAGGVELVTESGAVTFVAMDDYRRTALDFAGAVKGFYDKSAPKRPSVDYIEPGYRAFWVEWERRFG